MSDDLVKRLRLMRQVRLAADRIEELEATLRSMALDCLAADGQAVEAYQAQLLVEAKLAKAVEALDVDLIEQAISDVLSEGGTIRDAAEYVARTTLAELTGEKDE